MWSVLQDSKDKAGSRRTRQEEEGRRRRRKKSNISPLEHDAHQHSARTKDQRLALPLWLEHQLTRPTDF
jgi:hypothetical protein